LFSIINLRSGHSAESSNSMDAPALLVFIGYNDERFGPFTVTDLNAKLRSGEIIGNGAMAWYEGCQAWIKIDRVPGVVMPYAPPSFGSTSALTSNSQQGDATGGLIPYKNPMALTGYYLSIFGLIPVLGIPLAPAAIVLGIIGLARKKANPVIRGTVHAWVAIVLGALAVVAQIAVIIKWVNR